MRDTVIKLDGVGKKYRLSNGRRTLVKTFLTPFDKPKEVFALKDINLEIKRGETIGIVGENGSGKSTLLKIIAGITAPTTGEIIVDGRVGSLIELGAGFHQDLTGRENVYLNGILLGFTKKELAQKYKEIIDFADIGQYIEQPIRTYSSGMVVRLGFSVAIHLDPEILLIDEVLAVGDEEFQRKCLKKIQYLRNQKKTIMVVSHDFYLIRTICSKAILLNKGGIIFSGNPLKTTDYYFNNQLFQAEKEFSNSLNNYEEKIKNIPENVLKIKNVVIKNSSGKPSNVFRVNDTIIISVSVETEKPVYNPIFGLVIYTKNGEYLGGTNSMSDKVVEKIENHLEVVYKIDNIPLLPEKYSFVLVVHDKSGKTIYGKSVNKYPILIKGRRDIAGQPVWSGFLYIPCKWSYI